MRSEKSIKKPKNDNTMLYVASTILVLLVAALVMILTIYNVSIKKNNDSSFDSSELSSVMQNTTSDAPEVTSASKEIGKNVNEVQNENTVEKIAINTSNIEENKNTTKKSTDVKQANNINSNVQESIQVKEENTESVENKQLEFSKPVEGDVIREFAIDNLVYSNTLEEWITHNGIDIKSEQTTIVKASEAGKVKSIKNDPRYGLTIQIEHKDGYMTVYSNLLTSEFVVEGEDVEKGQTIGTVGNTSAFEISDESHLHFEILKDNTPINPIEILK